MQLRDVPDFGQKCGVQESGFRQTLEVEREIVSNREERLKRFDLFRALHLFEVRVRVHVHSVHVLSELTIDQEENLLST